MNYRACLPALFLFLLSAFSPGYRCTASSLEPPTPALFPAIQEGGLADINIRNNKGATALIMAARSGIKAAVKSFEGMKWDGHASQQTTKLVKVITDNDEWAALWRRAFDKKAPVIDFDHYAVACVFLGHEAEWLYSIAFGEPSLKDGRMVIPYWLRDIYLELAGPFKASGQYHMKVFQKRPGVEMILEEQRPME